MSSKPKIQKIVAANQTESSVIVDSTFDLKINDVQELGRKRIVSAEIPMDFRGASWYGNLKK